MRIELGGAPLSILDFDVECRPSAWYGGDWVTKEVTGIAWRWITKPPSSAWPKHEAVLLGEDGWTVPDMLAKFLDAYNASDMVTGHFIRGFDLPLLNGQLMEYQLPLLGDKMSHDTKLDMVKASGLSKSQENIGAMLELHHPKVQMNTWRWHRANRLTADGIKLARKRVTGDVKQHIELRQRMMELGMLGYSRIWSSAPNGGSKYAP